MQEFLKANIIEVVSLFLSLIAIGIAIWQSFRNRRFQLAMERPELKMGLTIVSNDRALEISLKNIGRGPAYITNWQFSANKSEWQPISWLDIFEALFPGATKGFEYQEQHLNAPMVVQPFSSVVLIKFRLKDEDNWFKKLNHVWRVYAHSVRLRIRYKSDLAKKEYELLADASENVPKPVEDFKIQFVGDQ